MLNTIQNLFKKKTKNKTVTKVKITKASLSTFWYADKIGAVFTVNPYLEKDGSYVVDLPYSNGCIKYEDCEVIG